MKPLFGVAIFPWGKQIPDMAEIIRTSKLAEKLDYHSIQIPYHLVFPNEWIFPHFGNENLLDAIPLIGAIAASTRKIKIAINSLVAPLFNPFFIARMISTMHHLSAGRLIVGIAPGWIKDEFDICNVSFDARSRITDEYLDVISKILTERDVTYNGKFVSISHANIEPRPSKPPQIWIAGTEYSVKRAAKFADFLCLYCKDVESVDKIKNAIYPKLQEEAKRYRRTCSLAFYTYAAVGTSDKEKALINNYVKQGFAGYPGEARFSELSVVGSVDECIDRINKLHEAGVSYFVLDLYSHGMEELSILEKRMVSFREVIDKL